MKSPATPQRAAVLAAVCALAVILPLVAPGPASAAPRSSRAVQTDTVALTAVDGRTALPASVRRSTSTRHATAELGRSVGVVAVVAPAGDAPSEVFIRTSRDGVADDWQQVALAADETDANGNVATEPVIVTDADDVEAVTTDGSDVELAVYTSTVTAADAVASDVAWSNPKILSRTAWGADESLVKEPYVLGKVTGAMIHHTAGSNTYSEADVPALLRSMQAYHVNSRGWNDIAYNVLVDRFGRAWQGRGGAVNTPVAGGHAWGETNRRVFGISLMGTYESLAPPAASITTLTQVIAWKLQMHRVDPYGTTWGSGGQDGGSTSLPAISGHRDENSTLCPGAATYKLLGSIRTRVSSLMDTVDYPGHWDVAAGSAYADEIQWVVDSGVSTGWPDGSYRPLAPISREAMAAFLYRLAGSPPVTLPASSPFTDVEAGSKFYTEIVWLQQSGVANGWPDGTFRPTRSVTREAMAAFLYRSYDGTPTGQPAPFSDVTDTPFATEIGWLATTGITTGWPDGTFRPGRSVTREAMAAFLYRAEHR